MVDVQQGDGLILETPAGKIVFVDGGANQLFARHAAARFLHKRATAADPLEVDAIIVTHGDGDHFDGLNDLRRSETASGLADPGSDWDFSPIPRLSSRSTMGRSVCGRSTTVGKVSD